MARKPAAAKPQPGAGSPILDRTTIYAQSVSSGATPAGPHVRDACARHLRDLVDGPARGLKWDVEAAHRVHSFFEKVLKLNGGEHEGVPFVLLDWQAFIVGSLFGWKNADDNTRRFRQAYVETGKGSGKSPLAAGIGLYMLTADGEPRAEVYAAASKRDQAAILFRDAIAMWNQAPLLKARLTASGGKGKEWQLYHLESGSFFKVVASEDGASGPRPHCALLDEIHEHHDSTTVEFMRAGTKGRRQALIYMITNSGSDRTSVCYEYHKTGIAVCAGLKQEDAFFAYICALDDGDDPLTDESCWPKANPSLGKTFQARYLRELVEQARNMPSKEAVVLRLNFCVWTDAETPWIDRDLWDKRQVDFDTADLCGIPCYGGLDLSSKRDLTAFSVVWNLPAGRKALQTSFWTPESTMAERASSDNVPYGQWVKEGHLNTTPGRSVTKEFVAEAVRKFASEHNLVALAFDAWQIDDFLAACANIGFDVWIDDRRLDAEGRRIGPEGQGLRLVRHGQGFAGALSGTTLWMPRSIGLFEDGIISGALDIQPNPVLRYNSACAFLEADAQGNRKWNKLKSTGRIDGMVASAMALGASAVGEVAALPSIWDRPSLWETPT